jgi:hypothetical protein
LRLELECPSSRPIHHCLHSLPKKPDKKIEPRTFQKTGNQSDVRSSLEASVTHRYKKHPSFFANDNGQSKQTSLKREGQLLGFLARPRMMLLLSGPIPMLVQSSVTTTSIPCFHGT